METNRRMGLVAPNFKDKRSKTQWTFDERLKLIQMCGLVSRSVIAKRLNRSNQRNIKERLKKDFKSGSKFLHGLPVTWSRVLFKTDFDHLAIKTTAGPTAISFFSIIPWVDVEQIAYAYKLDPTVKSCFKAMAQFQRFIWQEDDGAKIRRNIKKVIYGKRTSKQRSV